MAPEKTCGPLTTLSFAGIELDTIKLEARLPLDKLRKCIDFITAFRQRKKITLKELQSLIGLLNFACSVIIPGRAFLRRLIDLTHGIRLSHHLIKLNRESKEDLNVWLTFLTLRVVSVSAQYLARNTAMVYGLIMAASEHCYSRVLSDCTEFMLVGS